ncbi:hypothetical protein CRYUN_Cryun05aG0117600 [Craigia yunnanensis]
MLVGMLCLPGIKMLRMVTNLQQLRPVPRSKLIGVIGEQANLNHKMFSPKVDESCMKEQTELSGWGKKKSDTQYVLPIEENTFKSNGWDAGTSWGTMGKESEKPDASDALPWSRWGTKDSILKKSLDETSKSSGWGNVSSWGNNIVAVHESGFSGNDTLLDQGREESEWNNKASQENPVQLTSGWNNKVTQEKAVQLTSGWDKKATQEKPVQPTSGWVSSTAAGWTKDESPIMNSYWDQKKSPVMNSSLDQQKSPERSQGWGSLNESNEPASSSGWDMPHGEGNTQSEKQHEWGRSRGSRRWASDASKKNRLVKPARVMNDDSCMAAMYTATRQRLDMFTSEEEDILSDVEPLIQSIRKIMHQSGYNDGDPLSAGDQLFVLDNVFTHHPDKALKMGADSGKAQLQRMERPLSYKQFPGLTSLNIFYVVSTDGHKQDFSYCKCLDYYIKGKYPDLADDFIAKYFRKPRSGGNRERSVAPANTGGENRH